MLLDIVILPPQKLRRKIGKKIEVATKGLKPVFVVDNKKFIPHLSLFHVRTSKGRINKLEARIKEVLKEYRSIWLQSKGVELSKSGSGIIFYKVANPRELGRLRKQIFKACYPLRTGMMPWFISNRRPTNEELESRKKYGTHLKFHPHFTLTLLSDTKDVRTVARKIKSMKFKFLADTVAITEVNFWHQVKRIIKKFKLKLG